jgi:hypothetical protein
LFERQQIRALVWVTFTPAHSAKLAFKNISRDCSTIRLNLLKRSPLTLPKRCERPRDAFGLEKEICHLRRSPRFTRRQRPEARQRYPFGVGAFGKPSS